MSNITIYKEAYSKTPPLKKAVSAPFIYGMLLPLTILGITVEIYHQLCFRLYGIPLLNAKEYILIDGHQLKKLNSLEKFNCLYCGFANGLLPYAKDIAAETEKYWCAVKHDDFQYIEKQPHHKDFIGRSDLS